MINIQPIEKRDFGNDGRLDVHSVFLTIQGEGPFTGHAAVFVRLAGCNLQCPKCDTEYTNGRTKKTTGELLDEITGLAPAPHLVVITGGEPFRQDLYGFVFTLIRKGYRVQIETNGTMAPAFSLKKEEGWKTPFDALCSVDFTNPNACFIVCSPKAGKVQSSLYHLISAYKYVMAARFVGEDGLPLFALDHSAAPFVARPHLGFSGPIYLQPCDDKDETENRSNLSACIASVLKNGYILQLQVHKLIEME